jgi:hypothetical protein
MKSLAFAALLFTLSPLSLEPCNEKRQPKFENYSTTERFQGKVHPAILATPLDRKFRTVIREGVAEGVNFAGHYILVDWGCGTGCNQFVIVNAKTGTVYDPPFHWVDFHTPPKESDVNWWCYPQRMNYHKESRLLVIEGCLAGEQCGRTYFVIENRLKQLHYDPDLLSNGSIAPY